MTKPKQYARLICIEYQANDKYKLKRMSVAQIIEMGTVIEDSLTKLDTVDVEYTTPLHEHMALNLTGDDDV